MQLPTDDELHEIANATDALALAIRGHQILDTALNVALGEIISKPHYLELTRLSFSLKLDLGIALGIIPEQERAVLEKVNSVRNRYAHDRTTEFDDQQARELFNSLTSRHRNALGRQVFEDFEDPQDVLRCVIFSHYYAVLGTITGIRDDRVRDQVLNEMVEEFFGPDWERRHRDSPRRRQIEDRVAEERMRREEQGEP